MRIVNRFLLLGAPAALALLIAAPSALASSPFGDQTCDSVTSAESDLADGIDGCDINTSNLEDKDCEKLCKELNKICKKNVKNREKCHKDDDKSYFKIKAGLCKADNEDKQDRKDCQDGVKDDAKECKDDLKTDKADGEEDCEDDFGKDSNCADDCANGNPPFDCEL